MDGFTKQAVTSEQLRAHLVHISDEIVRLGLMMHPNYNERTEVKRPFSQVVPGIFSFLDRDLTANEVRENDPALEQETLASHSIASILSFNAAVA